MTSFNSSAHFNFFTSIRGRLVLLSLVFILALIAIPAIVYWKSTENEQAVLQIEEIGLPVPILTSRLISELNGVAASQRAYLLSADLRFKTERQAIWQTQIAPIRDSLNVLKKRLHRADLAKRLDSVQMILERYQKTQEDIDAFFEANKADFLITFQKQDTLSLESLLLKVRRRNELSLKITELATGAAQETRRKASALINEIVAETETSLRQNVSQTRENIRFFILLIVVISLVLVALLIGFAYTSIVALHRSIQKPIRLLDELSEGHLVDNVEISSDELGEVMEAGQQLSQNLRKAAEFAQKIGNKDFNYSFTPASDYDALGNALLAMRSQLYMAERTNQKRNWVTQGLAHFSDLIRRNSTNFETLGDVFLAELIQYLNANQGGIFIVREPDEAEWLVYLDMVSCYAYNRKKYLQKRIKVHPDYAETLVGQAYLEREKIYLKEVPEDYLRITSGLGDAAPAYLLLVPMLFNERIEGVLEIASFQALEDHQIELVEKLGESLAASVASVKNAERTTELLTELQEQTEMLRAQEEEMRQNMEELTITQEQMRIKQNELESLKANLEVEVQSRTRQLSESLIRFDLVNQVSSEGLWDMVVPEDEVLLPETPFFWSPQLKSNLGYGDAEFPNRLSSWMSILHPEDQERVFRQFVNFVKDRSGQASFLNEHRLKVKTGEFRWFRAYCQVLREKESGKALRVAGYINDITHQRELDEALVALQTQKETLQAQGQAMEAQNQKLKNNEQVLQKALLRNREKEKEMLLINKELAEKEERFHFMTANIPGIIYQSEINAKEKTSRYTFISDYISQVLGYSPEEFLTFKREEITQILHPSERDAFFEQYYESMIKMKPYAWEGRMRHQKGKWVWVKAQASPRQKGDTIIFDGILFDITEQHEQQNKLRQINQQLSKNEEELRQNLFNLHKTQQEMEEKQKDLTTINRKLGDNEQILKKALLKLRERESTIERRNEEITAILNASTDAILTINAEGIVQNANRVVETMFGFSPQELIGQNISRLMPSPDAEQHDHYIQRYLTTHEARILGKTRLVKARRKNGEEFDAIISVNEIKFKDQHFFTGFIRDLAQQAFIIAEVNNGQNNLEKQA